MFSPSVLASVRGSPRLPQQAHSHHTDLILLSPSKDLHHSWTSPPLPPPLSPSSGRGRLPMRQNFMLMNITGVTGGQGTAVSSS